MLVSFPLLTLPMNQSPPSPAGSTGPSENRAGALQTRARVTHNGQTHKTAPTDQKTKKNTIFT